MLRKTIFVIFLCTIFLPNINCFAESNNEIKLQTLRLNEVGLVPEFKNDIYEYDLTVSDDIENLEITAIPENQNAKVEIYGNTRLKGWRKFS